MNMKPIDTIAAISTPRGTGGIAVIRISGEQTQEVLARVFLPVKTDPCQAPRRACLGQLRTPQGEVLDQVLVVFFPAPNSFTGEPVAEISCHGGALLTQRVLGAVLAAGARPALAGEFTRRAVLGGKLSLSSAEALGALLDARTDAQMTLAGSGMRGRLSAAIDAEYQSLTALLADIYAKIDFPDEDLASLSREELIEGIEGVLRRTQALCRTWAVGRVVNEGIRTVICGPVNAGKSSLYNALVGEDAAIVTDVAGTTRDILSQNVALGQMMLCLYDTAGLRETTDRVEGIGVARAKEQLQQAELVLAVFDAGRPLGEAEEEVLAALQGLSANVVIVLNKCDTARAIDPGRFAAFSNLVQISAKNNEIGELTALLERLYHMGEIDLRQDAVVANARQFAALSRAAESLEASLSALRAQLPLDICSADAERAMAALGEVDGRAVSEDVVAEIFSHFCVGK